MRVELSTILVALTTFKSFSLLGILIDFLTNLHATQYELHHPEHSEYSHHIPLIQVVVATMIDREERLIPIFMRKFTAHTKVRGNELAQIAAKLAVTSLPKLLAH